MIKLKQVILQLGGDSYLQLRESFKKTRADNFVYLLEAYRGGRSADKDIVAALGISSNSFYVLKSRLYDRIQEHLSEGVFTDQETMIKQLLQVPEICFTRPRETAIAFLQKLEAELLRYDQHNDLMVVYSALKKMHLYSEKYFHYSQLFNKHAGLGLALEKAEENLGNFNRQLAQYNFSRSGQLLDTLNFLRIEIANLHSLNPSGPIGIIRNFVELQLILFGGTGAGTEHNTEELLQDTRKLFASLPESAAQKKWELMLDYLCFENYFSKSEYKAALQYYEKVNAGLNTLLLYNNVCLSSRFLVSKIRFCEELGRSEDLELPEPNSILYDSSDTHARVLLAIYVAMLQFRHKKIREAVNGLNEVLNTVSFKDYFHASVDVKMTLAFFYLVQKDYDLVELTVKGLTRKIKSEHPEKYNHVLTLIKGFENEMRNPDAAKSQKNRDLFTLFVANNHKGVEVLGHLIPELKKRYQS